MCALMPILASLGACAIPPALTVLSFATNAVSYAATGKSVSDHGISAVLGEDCALWRVLADRKICTPESPAVAGPASGGADAQLHKAPAVADSGTGKPVTEPVQLAAAPKAGRFLVLGAFIDESNAQHFAASVDGVASSIIAVDLYGTTFYRVIAGPLDDAGVKGVRERMALVAAVPPWEIARPRSNVNTAANPVATPVRPKARVLTAQNIAAASPSSPVRDSAPIRSRD
jgi:hypothetical protein